MSVKTQKSSGGAQSQPQKPSRFVVIHGDKGGVGKSFVAQAVADYLYSKGEKVAIIEADTANPDVERMFAGFLPSAKTNLRSESGWMDVMDFVVDHPGFTFIVNTPAGIGEHMKSDMTQLSKFLWHQDEKVEMELWWTMNVQHDSVNLFAKAMEAYGQLFSKIRVVCNLHFSDGNHEPFFLWNESPLKTRIENKCNGMTIMFPGLNLRVVKKMYVPENLMPFVDAVDAGLGEKIGLSNSERWKLQFWRSEIDSLFSKAFNDAQLVPAPLASIASVL